MKRPIRTLFYGATHEHAEGKFATLKRMADTFEIVAAVDDRASSCPYYVDEQLEPTNYNVIPPEKAFEIEAIEAVFIETSNANLMSVATECAKRGIPMHCDKPCGSAMEPYTSIVEMCRAKNVPMQIGYMYRGNPAIQFIWQAVKRGWLGDISFIEADMNHDYGKQGYAEFISNFSGGILYNLGCHLVDLIAPILEGMPLHVTTKICEAAGDPIGSKTRATSLLSWPNTDVLLRTSAHSPGGILCRRFRIDGSNGTIDLCPIERFDGKSLILQMTLKHRAGDYDTGCHTIDFGVQTDRYANQLSVFAKLIRGEIPNAPAYYDRDLRVHEIFLRMLKG